MENYQINAKLKIWNSGDREGKHSFLICFIAPGPRVRDGSLGAQSQIFLKHMQIKNFSTNFSKLF